MIYNTAHMSSVLLAVAALAALGGWSVTDSHEIRRPAGPASLGGITWISNTTYFAVTDWNPTVWKLTLPLDAGTAAPLSCKVKRLFPVEKGKDVEDLAIDPLDRSVLYAVDEFSTTLRKLDARNGKELGRLAMPGALARTRTDLGLESLAISPDGLHLWTTSEEAVKDDGPISDREHGSDVRLTRFTRAGANAPWAPDGQWVYRTDPIAGGSWKNKSGSDCARSGVSGLCLLGDGTLLALEREFSVVLIPRFRCRVYEVDFSFATDVSSMTSVTNAFVAKTAKRLLYEKTGFSMYEGICEGQPLDDGARSLVLVSDGDGPAGESILTLKLEKPRPSAKH